MALERIYRILNTRYLRNSVAIMLIILCVRGYYSASSDVRPTNTKVAVVDLKGIQSNLDGLTAKATSPLNKTTQTTKEHQHSEKEKPPSGGKEKQLAGGKEKQPAGGKEKQPVVGKIENTKTNITKAKTPPKTPPKPKAPQKTNAWFKAINDHIEQHRKICHEDWKDRQLPPGSKPLCDCVPDTLVGHMNVSFIKVNGSELEFPDVHGGHWEPKNCTARSRLVVIIPFRDRQKHLDVLLPYLHRVLQGQQLNYTILVAEQLAPRIFNKASLMNVGFDYAMNVHQPDCVVFHDVDHVPEDGRHFYYCRKSAIHLGAFHSRHNYRIIYSGIFGAVTAFKPETFQKINGFSNRYFGWGGEDDDMSIRLREGKLPLFRDPRAVAGYKVMTHRRDKGNLNPNRGAMISRLYRDRDSKFDGLNSLRYVFIKKVYYKLYEWFGAELLNSDAKIGFNLNEAA